MYKKNLNLNINRHRMYSKVQALFKGYDLIFVDNLATLVTLLFL